MNYFVYVKDLIGVETNLKCFKWSLGSSAPGSSVQDYSRCLIKIRLIVCKDKEISLGSDSNESQRFFRHFIASKNEIVFRQTVGPLSFGYWMSIRDNNIEIQVGKNYFHWVKYKIMNIHPIWYVLYDAVSCLLLKNNLTVLYGSSVETAEDRATIFMGAPGIGKTCTAIELCKSKQLKMISEDLLITDGKRVWSVPYTNTYRGKCNHYGVSFVDHSIHIKKIVILERGWGAEASPKDTFLQKTTLLNRYNVPFFCSPSMIAFEYVNPDFSLDSLLKTEEEILKKISNEAECSCLLSDDSSTFLQMFMNLSESER